MQNSIPTEAAAIIDTPEYSARWLNKTGEVWIAMKEPEAAVPHAAIAAVLQAVWNAGREPKTLYVSGDIEPFKSNEPAIKVEDFPCYSNDFGTVDIVRFKPAVTLSKDDIKAIQKTIDDEVCHLVNEIYHDPEVIEVDGVILIGERSYFQASTGLYRIRDVRDTPDSRFRCEYATKDEAGNTVWKSCSEGVNFAEIEPFEPIAA